MDYSDEEKDEDYKIERGGAPCIKEKNKSSKQNKINIELREKVIESIKSIF